MRCFGLMSVGLCVLFLAASTGKADELAPPIQRVKNVTPKAGALAAAVWNKPVVIRSDEDAAKYFGEDALATLRKQVDFKKQIVLVFAWKGSGQDRLEYAVAESFPEQIFFSLKPGKTRDLRSHVEVYALRSNVKWSTRPAGK